MPEPRQDLPIPLRVLLTRLGSHGEAQTEYAVNVSAGGLCMQLRDPVEVGALVGVDFTLPPDGLRVATVARVVWSSDVPLRSGGTRLTETGLRFEGLEDEIRDALYAYAIRPVNRRR